MKKAEETPDLNAFVESFAVLLKEGHALPEQIRRGRALISRLTASGAWFQEHMARLILKPAWRKTQTPTIWPNEVTIYRNTDPDFVVLAYFWEPGMVDTIHDHGSWGVVGCLFGEMDEIKYQRLDDGSRENYAELRPCLPLLMKPGETTAVLPLDQGIHRLGNVAKGCSVTINVYGKPVRRGYIRYFYPEEKRVVTAYPPSTHKAALAIRSLADISTPWAEELLRCALEEPLPDYLKEECYHALSRLAEEKGPPRE